MIEKHYLNGDIYIGEQKNGKREGRGLFVKQDVEIYIGYFSKSNPKNYGLQINKEFTVFMD